jgi:hypothetical protein
LPLTVAELEVIALDVPVVTDGESAAASETKPIDTARSANTPASKLALLIPTS